MSAYASFHVALMHAFLGIFAVLVLFLVLAGVVVLIAWANDRWQRRDRERSYARDLRRHQNRFPPMP